MLLIGGGLVHVVVAGTLAIAGGRAPSAQRQVNGGALCVVWAICVECVACAVMYCMCCMCCMCL